MDILTLLKRELEGKKMLVRERNNPDGSPNKHIMSIDLIQRLKGDSLVADVTIYPLDSNKALPFYEYDIELAAFSYQIIQTDDETK